MLSCRSADSLRDARNTLSLTPLGDVWPLDIFQYHYAPLYAILAFARVDQAMTDLCRRAAAMSLCCWPIDQRCGASTTLLAVNTNL